MKQQLLRYWLGMNASALDAAVHSTLTAGTAATLHAASPGIPEFDLKTLAVLFGVSFLKALREYVKAHPVGNLVAAPFAIRPELPVIERVKDNLDKVNEELNAVALEKVVQATADPDKTKDE